MLAMGHVAHKPRQGKTALIAIASAKPPTRAIDGSADQGQDPARARWTDEGGSHGTKGQTERHADFI
jgi:hypothetical protein